MSAPDWDTRELDFVGSRRLRGNEEWFWYLLAGATYVLASISHKFLLNWIIGPLWLVTFVVFGPALWDRLRRRFRRGPSSAEHR